MKDNLNAVVLNYLSAALWTDIPKDRTTSGEFNPYADDVWHLDNFDGEAKAQATRVCNTFLHESGDNANEWSAKQIGHDLWLTRNGHGSGFWAREIGTEAQRERLTTLAHSFGESSLYLGDDGKLYFA